MLEKLLLNLAMMLIEQLVKYAGEELSRLKEKAEKDQINKENAEAYKQAETRLEKIKNAQNLLNGSKP